MNVLEFTAAIHSELQNLLFPRFGTLGRIGIGGLLGMLDYNIGLYAAQKAESAKLFHLLDENGNVNLDCAESMILNLPFPLSYGPISIQKEEAAKIMQNIKARLPKEQKNESPVPSHL